MISRTTAAIAIAGALLGAACSPLGPDYQRPGLDLPQAWKSVPGVDPAQWRQALPADGTPRRDWWTLFGDPVLNDLVARSLDGNAGLQAAVARLDQALAQSNAHAAGLYPTLQLGATAARSRTSANRPLSSYSVPNISTLQTDIRPVLSASYELDLLGRVRRDIESARASAEQAGADLENVRLVLAAQVASTYLQLRQLDEELGVLSESIRLQEKVLDLVTKRYRLGASSEADLAQQKALTESSQAQYRLLAAERSHRENLLATLTGTPAADFRLPPGKLPGAAAAIPVGLPSSLLERRPDIAAAERGMAAANAQIGVAKAAYFPILTLSPTYAGYESRSLSNLVSVPSLVWSLGATASQILFDGGRTAAGVDFAQAGYSLAVANYRQAVLNAVQEAQDALDSLQDLELAQQKQDEAVKNQNRAYRIGLVRYREGLDSLLNLTTIQQNLLAAQRVQSQIAGSRFQSMVGLIRALGGGWESSKDAARSPAP